MGMVAILEAMINMDVIAALQSLATLQGLIAIIIGAVIGASLTYFFNRKRDYINRSNSWDSWLG